jgi:hypothetical protein
MQQYHPPLPWHPQQAFLPINYAPIKYAPIRLGGVRRLAKAVPRVQPLRRAKRVVGLKKRVIKIGAKRRVKAGVVPTNLTVAEKRASAKLVKSVKELERNTQAQIDNITKRGVNVAKKIVEIKTVLSKKHQAKSSLIKTSLIKTSVKKAGKVEHEIKNLSAESQLFKLRSKMLDDKSLSSDQRLKVLQDMDKSMERQEGILRRLGKMVTDYRFWAIATTAYGIYKSEGILNALGTAAGQVSEAVKTMASFASSTALNIACGILPFLGPIGWVGTALCGVHVAKEAKTLFS